MLPAKLRITGYPLHQLIRFGHLVIHITLSNPKIDEFLIRVIELPSLVYPYFQPDIERVEICKALLIKQKRNELNDFSPFC